MEKHFINLLFISFSLINLAYGNRDIGCFVEGECALWIDNHNLVNIFVGIPTPEKCLERCKEIPECLYFTHFQNIEYCYLYSSCEYFFYECENHDCISGEASCEINQLLSSWFISIIFVWQLICIIHQFTFIHPININSNYLLAAKTTCLNI